MEKIQGINLGYSYKFKKVQNVQHEKNSQNNDKGKFATAEVFKVTSIREMENF